MGDLAPRDVVAAAIDAPLNATGDPCVYLDARGIADFERRFPTVTAACRAAGIDPIRQPIPVVPGAHYSCGGVVTDVYGRTDLPGLFAAGEVARTGVHGANRLASNSLLEGLVVGGRAGKAADRSRRAGSVQAATAPDPVTRRALPRTVLQRAMSRDASVVRDAAGLQRLGQVLNAATPRDVHSRADFEDVALTLTAGAVAAAALARTETRGCHHRSDFPETDPALAREPRARREPAADAAERARADRGPRDDPACARRGSALRPRCDHAGDGARRCEDDRVDGYPRAGGDCRRRHCAAGARRGARPDGYRVARRWTTGPACPPVPRCLRRGDHPRPADRRADHAQPGVPPVRHRDHHRRLGGRGGGTDAKIRDTRKTLPGLRALQKYAVRVGGGVNPPDGPGRRRADQGQSRRGRRLGAGRTERSAQCRTGFALRGRGRLTRTARRRAEPERRTRTAGQLSGVADPDRRAAPRRPSARHLARILRRTFVGHRRGVRRGLAWTTSPSAPSPIRCGYWMSDWTSRLAPWHQYAPNSRLASTPRGYGR